MTIAFDSITTHAEGAGAIRLPKASRLGEFLGQFAPLDLQTWEPAQYETIVDYQTVEPAFLTVVTRTTGTRLMVLEETLLCLAAQSDQDFELCLVGHNLDDEHTDAVRRLVEAQPESLRSRIRFIVSRGKGRARPLNAGFAAARSSYAAILDDDDLVYDNWVESFHQGARDYPGRIIHCKVIDQAWEMQKDAQGRPKPISIGSPGAVWCCDFDPVRQFGVNFCPIMSLAFPLFVFHDLGLVFDEELTTTEDWDFLMRASFVCGVHNRPEATSVYRIWGNVENSHTDHDDQEWARNRLKILDKFRSTPILMPGEVTDTLTHASGVESRIAIFLDLDGIFAIVNDDKGNPLSDKLAPSLGLFEGMNARNLVTFSGLGAFPEGSVLHIQFPERKLITLWALAIYAGDGPDETQRIPLLDVAHNGIQVTEDELAYIDANPWIEVPLDVFADKLDEVTLSFLFRPDVDQGLLEGTRLVLRAKNKLKRIAHRIRK